MSTQKPERGWCVATGVNERTGRRYILHDTLATTRRGAIERCGREDYEWVKQRGGKVVRVLITIEEAETP